MLGSKIKELRMSKNINQQELADAIGVSKSTVAMWEVDKRDPTLKKVNELAKYFTVPADFLLGTGIFENWNKIQENKDRIIRSLYQLYPALQSDFQFDLEDENVFINVSNELLAKVEFNGIDMKLSPRIHPQDLTIPKKEMLEFSQEMLLSENFKKMNAEDKKILVEFSEFLANKYKNEENKTNQKQQPTTEIKFAARNGNFETKTMTDSEQNKAIDEYNQYPDVDDVQ